MERNILLAPKQLPILDDVQIKDHFHIFIKFQTLKLKSHESFYPHQASGNLTPYLFSAQKRAWFGRQRILNFRVIVVRDIKLLSRMSKNIQYTLI